ncbi:leucine-rich repeat-containing protein 49 [Hyla sarda]|uniref:leucine-rich repeat-containing protein 49 n=1 Tax=Hyla sarda TaxID=327740 RepID=UPI0024C408C5|nr:leucine-rich repeat-containing protein 49 [Hyla sarda]
MEAAKPPDDWRSMCQNWGRAVSVVTAPPDIDVGETVLVLFVRGAALAVTTAGGTAVVTRPCRAYNMLPGKYRGRLVSNVNNCGLHLVLQATPVADKNKQFDFRLSKDTTASLNNRHSQHDFEKNITGRQDGRLSSPVNRNKQPYIPLSSNVTEVFSSATRYGRDAVSLGAFGELPGHKSKKSRSRSVPHCASPNNNNEDLHHSKVNHFHSLKTLKRSELGCPVVHRTVEEKAVSPDKLNLERQNFAVFPIIEGEEQLRLLYLQHNFITRIQNISCLQRLIFIDLYDNQIEEISGLSSLKSLRVLMLGKNKIQKISNLENLKNLDVLDLHGNQISKIENIGHLGELRVLNLARNQISQVENLIGLDSLTELNLRHNSISVVRDVDTLPSLQILYLSFNNISRLNDILCLADSTTLSDVTLDGNPIVQESWYRQTILGHMLQLRQLDMKRITEEERRTASVLARKEEERKRESHKQALLKEKKRIAIQNAAKQWDIQQNRVLPDTISDQEGGGSVSPSHKSCQLNGSTSYEFNEDKRSLDTVLSSSVQGLSVVDSHLVELEGDTLSLYGLGALECLDRTWSVQTAGSVTTFSFTFINFEDIVQVLPKIRIKFPNATHLKFKENNLITLNQFNALAQMRRLDQLTVDPQGNPVLNFTHWKYYVLFRLNNFNIQKINENEVTQNDVVMAERLFGILAYVANSELPQYRLSALLGDSRKKTFHHLLETKSKKIPIGVEESNDNKRTGETPTRAALQYIPQDLLNEKLEELTEKKAFCQAYVKDLVNEANEISLKNESLQKLWPQMFIELVRDAVIEVRDKNSYMKQCLHRISEQK